MPSNYAGFDVIAQRFDSLRIPCANATVKVWRDDTGVDLGVTLTADANGHVAGGTLSVPVGTRVRFRMENFQGYAGYTEQVTT